jgi:hypothetical protein
MASILFIYYNNPSSIVSNMITFFIPPALSAGRTSFRVPLPLRPRVFGWLSRVFASFIGRLRPRRIFFLLFFVDQFDGRTDATAFPCSFRPGRIFP